MRRTALAALLALGLAAPATAAPHVDFLVAPGLNNGPQNYSISATDHHFLFDWYADAGDSVTAVNCNTDGGPFTNCVGSQYDADIPIVNPPPAVNVYLDEGPHTVIVRVSAVNSGVPYTTDFPYSWFVDSVKPDVVGLPQLSNTSITHYVLGQAVPDVYCTDASPSSGIALCTPTTVDTSQLGTYENDYTAVDNAGNFRTYTRDYRVDPPPYASLILGDDPVAYYKFEDGLNALWPANGGAADSSAGGSHPGSYENEVMLGGQAAPTCQQLAEPPFACAQTGDTTGSSASFDGGTTGAGYVRSSVPHAHRLTIEADVRPIDTAERVIADIEGDVTLGTDGAGHYRCVRGSKTVTGGSETGDWTHVACVLDGFRLRLYVNGVQEDSIGAPPLAGNGPTILDVGRANTSPGAWRGLIDELAYYDHAVSGERLGLRSQLLDVEDENWAGSEDPEEDVTPPRVVIASPPADAQYSVDAQSVHRPAAIFFCDDPGNPGVPISEPDCHGQVFDSNGFVADVQAGDPLPFTGDHYYRLRVGAKSPSGLQSHLTHFYSVFGPAGSGFANLIKCTPPSGLNGPFPCGSPISYWRLDEAPGDGTLHDQMGSHPGTFRNDSSPGGPGISGDQNSTRAFFGRGGYAEVGGIDDQRHAYTFEAWVEPRTSGDMWIADHGDATELFITGGQFAFRPERREPLVLGPATGPMAPTPGQWSHVVATWDGMVARLYVNGNRVASHATSHWPNGTDTLYLGRGDNEAGVGNLDGRLDEVTFYGVALSGDTILQHYLADPPAPAADGLLPVSATSTVHKPTQKPRAKAAPAVRCGRRVKGARTCRITMARAVKRLTVNAGGRRVAARKLRAGRGTVRLKTRARRATFLGHVASGRVVKRVVVKLR